ncbi:Tuberin [Holothuria leucospilota]|uniref:Tuberin n=1 Tax=Holothuria leucospilota TaxID=206669 RepID=A0A9Q1C3C6_HOLLE|nr:Tuberin [Holothuria leucospilota]
MSKQPTLKQRVHNLLFKNKDGSSQSNRESQRKVEEFFITASRKKELSQATAVHLRIKAIKELCSLVTTRKLEDHGLETIWANIADLLDPCVLSEHRQLVLHFLKCLIIGQYEYLGVMRAVFFQVIRGHNVFDDLPQKLDVFKALSDNGKNLLDFEEETGPFLEKWMPDVISYGKTADFLRVLVNVIKYNACFMDEDIIMGFVRHTCSVCNQSQSEEEKDQALKVLEAVVAYSCLPTESLSYFIVALCNTVNITTFCEPSWKLMRNLLGTHLGHSAIYTMCSILEDGQNIAEHVLLRGAVFFVGMALWGSKRVPTLRHRFMSILPSFYKALQSHSVIVAYEVALSVQRLVKKYGKEIPQGTWDCILDITEELFRQLSRPATSDQEMERLVALNQEAQSMLTHIEELYSKNEYDGSAKKLFAVVEEFASQRPESSLLSLVAYRAQVIHPTKPDWIPNLQHLMEKYFKKDMPVTVREKTVRVLSSVLSATSHLYEDDLIEMVVLPHFSHIADDPSSHIRNVGVRFLLDVAQVCQMERCLDVMDIIAKVIMKPLHTKESLAGESPEKTVSKVAENDSELVDIQTAVLGLLEMFKTKLNRLPSSHAVAAFEMLVKHMLNQYHNQYQSEVARRIRAKLRADSLGRLGLPDDDGVICYSPYILCDSGMEMDFAGKPSPPMATSPPVMDKYCRTTILPFGQSFKVVTISLRMEVDWRVLQMVIHGLTKALQNKTLVLASHANVDLLCTTMFAMIESPNKLNSLINVPSNFHRMDFFMSVYGLLTALVPYHSQLKPPQKVSMVKFLKSGLKLQCPQQCIDGMMLCVLEMQDTMVKLLPSIILELSKMSATPSMAVPVLEFLSSLIWFPNLYASFVETAYMSIFAVALHYTNPYKFSLYVVSLAHHVIAMWFIKCRLPFRREFVNCITRGLNASCMRPGIFSPHSDTSKQTGRGLRRTNSLTKISSKRGKSDNQAPKETTNQNNDHLDELHKQLTETCLDMMARFTFSTCTTMPKRSPISEFLLVGGQSQSWLLGNKIITITTSGGSTKMQDNGICEKCNALIRSHMKRGTHVTEERVTTAPRVVRQRSKSGNSKEVEQRQDATNVEKVSGRSRPSSGPPAIASTHEGVTKDEEPSMLENKLKDTSPDMETSSTGGGSVRLSSGSLYQCNCWCKAWAEVHVRRATGNTSWIMRIQNDGSLVPLQQDLPLMDISSLLMYNREIEEHILSFLPDDSEESEVMDEEAEESDDDSYKSQEVSGAIPIPGKRVLPPNPPQFLLSPQEELTELDHDSRYHSLPTLHKDLDEDQLTVNFPRTELGLSPQPEEGTFLDNMGVADKFCEFAKTLRLVDKDAKNLDRFDWSQSKIQFHKSKSCPVLELAEDDKSKSDHTKKVSTMSATSPISLARSVLQESAQRPSSFKDMSYLEKRYSQELGDGALSKEGDVDGNDEVQKGTGVREDELKKEDEAKAVETIKAGRKKSVDFILVDTDGKKESKKEGTILEKPSALPLDKKEVAVSENKGPPSEARPRQRQRGHTFSAISRSSHVEYKRAEDVRTRKISDARSGSKEPIKSGIDPSFVFLQLYYSPFIGVDTERPLAVPLSQVAQRAVKVLDRIPPYDTHKIGVLYVGPDQVEDEIAILSNVYGSTRYMNFLQGLGKLIPLQEAGRIEVYTGGLDTSGNDGKFVYWWKDDIMQVIFHVATLMPNKESDPNCTAKKLHIGNDFVSIVYNESGQKYKLGTIKGQFNFAEIIVEPLDKETNLVTVQAKPELEDWIGARGPWLVSDKRVALLVRQMALHANLASQIHKSQVKGNTASSFSSNWLERLRQIGRIRSKLSHSSSQAPVIGIPIKPTTAPTDTNVQNKSSVTLTDFSQYT